MSDAQLRRQVARLASELARTQAEVHTLRRGARRPQLGNSSIDSGSLDVIDSETGRVRLRLGYQPDGSVGVVPEGGDPHPAPATPMVEPIPSGLSVSWDGTLDGLDTLPADFDHVNVYVSPEPGFTPGGATFVGTITRAGGTFTVAPLEVGETYYVRLVPVGTGGVQGTPSAQASGVPAPVGGVPGPGSITETEIADDAISTPKLQAEAVTALKIAAQAIEAGHIQAAAITASKLEADLVLGTRIIAGDPSGARVELDDAGLRGYDADDALVFAIEDGDAVFSGTVTGSEIVGSRLVLGDAPVTGVVESSGGQVIQRVQSGLRRAQLAATDDQANFLAVSETGNPNTHAAGIAATDDQVQLDLNSDNSGSGPAVTGLATSTAAEWSTWSDRGNTTQPHTVTSAVTGRVMTLWDTPGGGQVQVVADVNNASLRLTGPDSASTSDKWGHFAGAYGTDDSQALTVRSPERDGVQLRSMLVLESDAPTRDHTRAYYYADEHRIRPGLDGQTTVRPRGLVRLDTGVSVHAPAHAPLRTEMVAQPTVVGGGWVPFPEADYPSIPFRTGHSGRVRFTITAAAGNTNTANATVHFGVGISGASTVAPAVTRAWNVRSLPMQCSSRVLYLDLLPDSEYVMTPHYNISSGAIGDTVNFQTTYENSYVVEPLM